jgi:hypothetical protein
MFYTIYRTIRCNSICEGKTKCYLHAECHAALKLPSLFLDMVDIIQFQLKKWYAALFRQADRLKNLSCNLTSSTYTVWIKKNCRNSVLSVPGCDVIYHLHQNHEPDMNMPWYADTVWKIYSPTDVCMPAALSDVQINWTMSAADRPTARNKSASVSVRLVSPVSILSKLMWDISACTLVPLLAVR